jgi:tripartite ATP-independent transporter DctP family solute receptor
MINKSREESMSNTITRRQVLAYGASTIVASAALGSTAAYAQKQTLRLGHVLAPTHPFHLALEQAARDSAAATSGALELQVFPSSQLGTERDLHVAIRTGGVEMLLGSPGGASVHLKELAILTAPYLFRDDAHWQAVAFGEIGEGWKKRIVEQSGVHIVGWFPLGTRHVVSRTAPFETIAAIQGQKIRVADLAPYPQVFQGFGAIPTPIAFAEMYQALEAGIVDGADTPLDIILSQKLFEVSKFVNLIGWSVASPGPILISDATWQQLSEEHRAALQKALRGATDYVIHALTDGEAKIKQDLENAGMTLVTPTDLPAWQDAAAKAIPALAETWGGDVSLYQKIRDVGA